MLWCFNCIKFEGKKILINNLKRYNKNISLLENSCLLFYSGKQRESSMITKNLIKKMRFNEKHFNNIKNLTKEGLEIIKSSNFKIGIFGDILREACIVKIKFPKILIIKLMNYLTIQLILEQKVLKC